MYNINEIKLLLKEECKICNVAFKAIDKIQCEECPFKYKRFRKFNG